MHHEMTMLLNNDGTGQGKHCAGKVPNTNRGEGSAALENNVVSKCHLNPLGARLGSPNHGGNLAFSPGRRPARNWALGRAPPPFGRRGEGAAAPEPGLFHRAAIP